MNHLFCSATRQNRDVIPVLGHFKPVSSESKKCAIQNGYIQRCVPVNLAWNVRILSLILYTVSQKCENKIKTYFAKPPNPAIPHLFAPP